MILKCGKTGKIFFTQQEATAHGEAIGSANFDEVSPDQKILVDKETKRRCFWSEDEVTRFKQRTRDPEFQTVEITVKEYQVILQEHEKQFLNDIRVIEFCKKKLVDALVEVKGFSAIRAEKACWFTGNKGVSEAEAWIEAHKHDEDIDKPLRLPKEEPKAESTAAPMEVDQEGDGSGGTNKEGGETGPESGEGEGGTTTVTGDGDTTMVVPSTSTLGEGDGTDPSATENSQFVKSQVKKEFLDELVSMGFSELRSEKALYFIDNAGIEPAVNWLTDHSEDTTIDHGIVKDIKAERQAAANLALANAKPKMSKEEAEKKALELQERLKNERIAREKQEAKDKEKARIESTKMMNETNALLEEENRKRAIEQRKREALEHEKHAAELKERLRLDYIERFGKEPPAEEEKIKDDIKSKPSKQQALYWINQLKKHESYTKDSNGEGKSKLITCIKTLTLYLKNARENPDQVKYQTLKKSGKAFSERISPFSPDVLELLRVNGFRERVTDDGSYNVDDDVMSINGQVDGWLMGETIKFLDLIGQKL